MQVQDELSNTFNNYLDYLGQQNEERHWKWLFGASAWNGLRHPTTWAEVLQSQVLRSQDNATKIPYE